MRALALIAEVTHGAPLSFRDPVTYTFAVGGKDGWPYPVDRNAYDRSVAFLEKGIREAKLGNKDKLDALRRLDGWSRSVGRGEGRSQNSEVRMQNGRHRDGPETVTVLMRTFPTEFVERYSQFIPDFDAFLDAMQRPLKRTFRVNTLKATRERALELLADLRPEPLPWYELGFSVGGVG